MFKYTKDGVSVSVILDARRTKANGKYPVKVQVAYLRKQKYYATGKDLDRSEWEKLPATKLRTLIDTREQIEASYNIVRDYVRELTDNGNFTFEALSLRLKGAATADINTTLRMRYEEAMNECRYNSASSYKSTITSVEAFAGRSIKYADITTEWLRRYEQFELNRGNSYGTIITRVDRIRACVNYAEKLGIVKPTANPFTHGAYKTHGADTNKRALTIEQIKRIAKFEGTPIQERYRDYWLFIYLCNGINIADLARLKWSNVENGEISFERQKTAHALRKARTIKVIITPEMQEIIDRIGNPSSGGNVYMFPILSDSSSNAKKHIRIKSFTRCLNKFMTRIGEELGIGKVTSYTARHSFATTLKRSGVNIAYISEALGHTNLQMTETYLASFEREERQKNAQILVDILK